MASPRENTDAGDSDFDMSTSEEEIDSESESFLRPATLFQHKISMNDKENQYFREKICMTKENIRKSSRIPKKNLYFAKF